MSRIRWSTSRLVIAAVVGCLAPIVVMSPGGAAPPPVATSISIDSIVTPGVTVPLTLDTPSIWVAANTPFTVTATGKFGTTNAPLSNSKDVTVKVTAVTPAGNVTLLPVVFPAGVTTVTFSRQLPADIDDAVLRLESVERRSDPVRSGQSATFDVQSEFNQSDASTAFDVAIGGAITGTTCQPTVARPVCFQVHIPAGAASGNHLLSLGNCNIVNPCRQNVDYWWSLIDVHATRSNPAVTDMGLDKSLKGILIENGVPKAKWLVRASGSEVWVEAPSCPSKGIVGPDQDFCQDTTASKRDNSGDTWIRLLWLSDLRGSTK